MCSRKATLYSRNGCHLCDEALELLETYGFEVTVVDIDQNPQLVEQFCNCIPVVEIDGKIRFRGEVNEVLLLRLL